MIHGLSFMDVNSKLKLWFKCLMHPLYTSFSEDDDSQIRICGAKEMEYKIGVQRFCALGHMIVTYLSFFVSELSCVVITQACKS